MEFDITIRFMDVPFNPDFERWAREAILLLKPAGFELWLDTPVFFITQEMAEQVGGLFEAIGVADFSGTVLVNSYKGSPSLPNYIYEELEENGAVPSVGISYKDSIEEDDPKFSIQSTLLHELGHIIYETSYIPQFWPETYKKLKKKYKKYWWAKYLFDYGEVEGFCEIFQAHLLNKWYQKDQKGLGRDFALFLKKAEAEQE